MNESSSGVNESVVGGLRYYDGLGNDITDEVSRFTLNPHVSYQAQTHIHNYQIARERKFTTGKSELGLYCTVCLDIQVRIV